MDQSVFYIAHRPVPRAGVLRPFCERDWFEPSGLVVRCVLEQHGRDGRTTGGLTLYGYRRRLADLRVTDLSVRAARFFHIFETRLFRAALAVRAAIVAPTRGGKNRKP